MVAEEREVPKRKRSKCLAEPDITVSRSSLSCSRSSSSICSSITEVESPPTYGYGDRWHYPYWYSPAPLLYILNSFLVTSGYVKGVKVRYELQAIVFRTIYVLHVLRSVHIETHQEITPTTYKACITIYQEFVFKLLNQCSSHQLCKFLLIFVMSYRDTRTTGICIYNNHSSV